MINEFMSLNQNIKIRLLTSFLSRFFGNMVYPFMAIYFAMYYSVEKVGLLLTIVMVIAIGTSFISGYFSDKYGKKNIMIFAQVLQVISLITMLICNSPIFTSPWITFLMMILQNVSTGILNPAAEAMVIDDSNSQNRDFIYSVDYWAANLSIAVGMIIGGLLFKKHLFLLFCILTLSAFIVLYMLIFWIEKDQVIMDKTNVGFKQSMLDFFTSFKQVLRDKGFSLFCLSQLLVFSLDAQITNYVSIRLSQNFSTYFSGIHITGIMMSSLIRSENTMIVVLLSAPLTMLISAHRPIRSLISGLIMYIFSYGVIIASNNFYFLIIAMFIASVGELLVVPLSQSMLANLSKRELRGTYMSVHGFVFKGTKLFGAFGVSLSAFLQPQGISLLFCGIAILGLFGYIFVIRKYTGI